MADPTYVLRISPGPTYPPTSAEPCFDDYLEADLQLDILQSCWGNRETAPPQKFDRPNVRYHFTYSSRKPAPVRLVWDVIYFVAAGLKIHRSLRRYGVIITYGPTKTALAGLVLKWLTGAKLVVEFPGDPRTAYIVDAERRAVLSRVKHDLARLWTRFLLRWVDRAATRFPGQLDIYPEARNVPQTVCPVAVAVDAVPQGLGDDHYVLLLGFPWHLKGVDILIRAFRHITSEFPDYRLKIVGHCPNRRPYEQLRGDCERIEFYPGVYRPQAFELIGRCTVLVLASRSESMGRVLIEAMAAGKPVIASRVGGIPHYVEDGKTGLLFESEDVDQLATCLRRVLADKGLRRRLGDAGYARAHSYFRPQEHARRFAELIRQSARPVVR